MGSLLLPHSKILDVQEFRGYGARSRLKILYSRATDAVSASDIDRNVVHYPYRIGTVVGGGGRLFGGVLVVTVVCVDVQF